MERPIEIRQLIGHDEYLTCAALEKETWGVDFAECVPPAILMISQKVGGVTAGAFDDTGRLMGFVYGLTGIKDGQLVHWSHMLAVRPEVRNSGLGTRLKQFQRDQVRALGVETMYWTFDPLVAKNAHLNLNHLGTHVEQYVEDMYIDGNESELHRGLGMDRFVVRWRLAETETGPEASEVPFNLAAPLVNTKDDSEGNPVPCDVLATDQASLRIEIPLDIHQIQTHSLASAAAWRDNTRVAFTQLMDRGYVVAGFRRDPDTQRCFYFLTNKSGIP